MKIYFVPVFTRAPVRDDWDDWVRAVLAAGPPDRDEP